MNSESYTCVAVESHRSNSKVAAHVHLLTGSLVQHSAAHRVGKLVSDRLGGVGKVSRVAHVGWSIDQPACIQVALG